MDIIVLWLILGGAVAVVANSKGFDTLGWLVYGALIPPVALAHVIVKPALPLKRTALIDAEAEQDVKRCPDCAETVKAEALVCRFCGFRDFPERPAENTIDENDEWFASIDTTGFNIKPVVKPVAPPPTTWQKLWWNPNPPERPK